ncbi:MAG: hypothetical protein AAFV86_14125 [Pseudomonadota bacterium]
MLAVALAPALATTAEAGPQRATASAAGPGGHAGAKAHGAPRLGKAGPAATPGRRPKLSIQHHRKRLHDHRPALGGKVVLAPFAFDNRDDDVTVIVLPPAEPPAEPEPAVDEAAPRTPSRPVRLRADGRPGDGVADGPAVALTLGAAGDSVALVAAALDEKRRAVIRALEVAGLGFCLDAPDAFRIARDPDEPRASDRRYAGERRLTLRVADADVLLGVLAALPEDTVTGVGTLDTPPADAVAPEAEATATAPRPRAGRPGLTADAACR